MRLAGKTVLLTGGGSGIGFALARQLAAKGARLALCGRRPEPLDEAVRVLRAAGGEAIRVRGDVAQEDDRARMVDDTVRQLGGLDVLINNAGNVRAGRLEATHAADIQAMIEVDLLAPILMTQLALPYLRRSGEALIVNIASGIALIGMPFYAAYAAAKAGLARFGEALRRELHGEGVRVLTAYPGATDTPMMASSKAGPDLGFVREAPEAVAAAIVEGIERDALEVIRGGEARAKMIAFNRENPRALDERFASLKPRLLEAVKDHRAL